jgi:hypothetical protein
VLGFLVMGVGALIALTGGLCGLFTVGATLVGLADAGTAWAILVAGAWPIGFGLAAVGAGAILALEKDMSKDHPRDGFS